jgi:carboxyl-terminal processing protease
MCNSTIVDGLKQRSQDRIARSEYFAKANREIARYAEIKEKKTVTLNREKYLKERAEMDADKEQEKLFDGMTDPKRPVYEMNGYGEEALDITVDYLDLLGGNRIAVAQPGAAAPAAGPSLQRGTAAERQ